MNALYMRDTSRLKLSLRYGANSELCAKRDRAGTSSLPSAELRRIVAGMVD